MKIILITLIIILGSSGAYAGWIALWAANNNGIFLLDGSSGFLTSPYPGKIFAR